MALLSPQQISKAGLAPSTTSAAGGGDTVATGDRVYLYVNNGAGAPITVTIATPGTVSGLAVADQTVSVTNGTFKLIGPITRELFGDDDGIAAITYSSATSVTVAALKG